MSGDDLFAAEEDVIASGEQLVADGGFGSVEDKRRYQQLLKNYQKLFRTTRRLMRLSDHNEQGPYAYETHDGLMAAWSAPSRAVT